MLTCIGCLQTQSIEAMIVFRFVQALGGCVAGVAAIAMVRDFFPVEESAKILSLLILILGLSPLLAPTIGGFITTWLGWHWIFILLIIIAFLILLLSYFFLPENYKPDPTVSLRVRPMVNIFLSILKNPSFYTYTLAGAFSFASLFVYVTGSPVIFMEIFKVSPQLYGGIFAMLSVGFIGGNQLNILLLRKYKSEQIFKVGLTCQVITNLVFVLGVSQGWYGLIATIVLLFFSLSCLGFVYPNSSALALMPFDRNIGSASALLGILQIGIAGIVSVCVGLFNSKEMLPLVAMMAGSTLIAFIILMAGRKARSSMGAVVRDTRQ